MEHRHNHDHHHDKHPLHVPVPKKTFELRPISELLAIVRNDFRKLDDEGMIDEGRIIKTIMACNDRLGIPIRQIKQVCIPVEENKANLPLNFEKMYFVTALQATNTMVHSQRNPFNNNFDRDVIYEADVDRGSFGNVDSYSVTIKRIDHTTIHNIQTFIGLDVSPQSFSFCHASCPNMRKKGRYTVTIEDDHIITPFRSGELYIMYLGTMEDEDGNLLYPFHPLITPYYEWSIKEKVLMDCIFNSDGNYGELLKLAQNERVKAWLDAFSITTERGYGEYVDMQKKKELGWYNQYFKFFQ
jgi:hypothetical protein